jgi:hypothetical protein
VEVAYRDSSQFCKVLKRELENKPLDTIKTAITHFLDYCILHKAQWRMITHFALHGKTDPESLEKLNEISRQMMDLFVSVFKQVGFNGDCRLLAHTLFSALSGILIAFRNYPGRTEEERIAHMNRIGEMLEAMITSLIEKETNAN